MAVRSHTIVERQSTDAELIDVLDRVLDKGIVIDATVRVTLADLNLIDIDMRIVVASVETYVKDAESHAFAKVTRAARPLENGLGGEDHFAFNPETVVSGSWPPAIGAESPNPETGRPGTDYW